MLYYNQKRKGDTSHDEQTLRRGQAGKRSDHQPYRCRKSGCKNGPEIHEITDTAIINIYNKRSHKLVTKLIARPGQIRRYYNGNAPQEILEKAFENMKKGYNLK